MGESRVVRNLLAPGCALALIFGWFLPGCGEDGPSTLALDTHPGKTGFENYCAACHSPEGAGMKGGAPPLLASPWVLGPEARLIRIVLHGLRGPLEVGGGTYNLEMPGFGGVLDDGRIAAVLSYVRARYGRGSAPVLPAAVSRVRAAARDRDAYWTVEELLQLR